MKGPKDCPEGTETKEKESLSLLYVSGACLCCLSIITVYNGFGSYLSVFGLMSLSSFTVASLVAEKAKKLIIFNSQGIYLYLLVS